jgi:hypothetical protein
MDKYGDPLPTSWMGNLLGDLERRGGGLAAALAPSAARPPVPSHQGRAPRRGRGAVQTQPRASGGVC